MTLTQLDGNLVEKMGRIEYTIVDASAGGSRIVCERTRYFRGDLNGRLRGTIMQLVGGRILRRQFRLGLDRWAALGPGGSAQTPMGCQTVLISTNSPMR